MKYFTSRSEVSEDILRGSYVHNCIKYEMRVIKVNDLLSKSKNNFKDA